MRFSPKLTACSLVVTFLIWIVAWHGPAHQGSRNTDTAETPLVEKYIGQARGDGGRWFIPNEWLDLDNRFLQPYSDIEKYMDIRNPRSPAEAAQMALELCMRRGLYLEHSKIPLVVHQTWKNTDSSSWTQLARDGVEKWLRVATGISQPELPKMAYVFWDDQGIDELISLYEPELWGDFQKLPHPVEKADIFRVAVLKWFGGVYADIDAEPLQHPYQWVQSSDLRKWTDRSTAQDFNLHKPVVNSYEAPDTAPARPRPMPDSPSDITPASYRNLMSLYAPKAVDVAAIFGLEADTPPDTNDYWRAGYSFNVQVTNWALAMAPQHPVSSRYIQRTAENMRANMSRISKLDPLDLTGPPALTATIKDWSESENPNFVWASVGGLQDPKGGRGKIIAGDVMILPITGFSPGRGSFHNMGSQPLDHPNARLSHVAQGSWRHTNIRVEAGKLCRTLLGACRDWSKVP